MEKKVILMSIDGMRPDGFLQCGHPFVNTLMKTASYTLKARTCVPSVTLPCHMSMFHGVAPDRHGILTNEYVPQVRPVRGLFEKVRAAKGTAAFFYGWEPLRDIGAPDTLKYATYINAYKEDSADTLLTDRALELLKTRDIDFCFLYQVDTDERGGHECGWMSEGYLKRVYIAIDNAQRMIEAFGDRYAVVITADHGGHDRMHGTELPEDMTIPMFFLGKEFEKGKELTGVTLLDIAPTVADLLGLDPEPEWEGRSLVQH